MEGDCRAGENLASGPASARSIRAAQADRTRTRVIFRAVRPTHFPGRFSESFSGSFVSGPSAWPLGEEKSGAFPLFESFSEPFSELFSVSESLLSHFRVIGGP